MFVKHKLNNTMREENNKIPYHEIMALGFKTTKCHDEVYFREYGYAYEIIECELTKKLSLVWSKETQICDLIRIDNKKEGNIMKQRTVRGLSELKQIIDFFTDTNE